MMMIAPNSRTRRGVRKGEVTPFMHTEGGGEGGVLTNLKGEFGECNCGTVIDVREGRRGGR